LRDPGAFLKLVDLDLGQAVKELGLLLRIVDG